MAIHSAALAYAIRPVTSSFPRLDGLCLACMQLLRDALPEGVLEVDHSLTHAQLSKDGHSAVLQFADGEAVQAKLLVAADGYFSAVRQSIVQDGPPEFAVRRQCQHARSPNARTVNVWRLHERARR